MNIKSLPSDERPRERLMEQGAAALSPAELLAILIGSGNTEETAVQLCQRLLADCDGSLKTLSRLSLNDLTRRYKGLGPAKAVTILAACELGRRRSMEVAAEKRYVQSSLDVYQIMYPRMRDLSHEESYALYLRADGSLEGQPFLVSKGGLTATAVDLRLVLREALIRQTPTLVLCHNHPSGNKRPSRDDDALTERLASACRTMGFRLQDHVIITDGDYFSYREEGKV
ncbi:MAG: DNA repair protein RadC [Bacteroidaceae bacterium]|nr:DNA repair protein RadC [Bacteroidaceae bacterium]